MGSALMRKALEIGETGTGPTFEPDWLPPFKQEIHGLIIFTGDSHNAVDAKMGDVLEMFGIGTPAQSISEVTRIAGDVRPDPYAGHEHFGFLDGISKPAVAGFNTDLKPGPPPVHPGIILIGRDGDANAASRDPWMIDGSLLAFRYLFQLVPEFDKFLEDNSAMIPGLSKELLDAGRAVRLFGPEMTKKEQEQKKTLKDRGLIFQCSIDGEFEFIQTKWANNPGFPFTQTAPQIPGFDPIIGQGPNRLLSGFNPDHPSHELPLPELWVVTRGGEYFFVPSLKGLKETIALT
ncbi:hypothetical protein AX17_006846 [Amanita inopinata Kibby_2008]|nr:hypothetical protein AX17_006846 [Amanita inopinata Kibby_2008]